MQKEFPTSHSANVSPAIDDLFADYLAAFFWSERVLRLPVRLANYHLQYILDYPASGRLMGARGAEWGGAARRYCSGHDAGSESAAAAWTAQ